MRCGCEEGGGPLDRDILIVIVLMRVLGTWCGCEERGAGVREAVDHLTERFL